MPAKDHDIPLAILATHLPAPPKRMHLVKKLLIFGGVLFAFGAA
jgi:hypothetical protein